MHTRSTDNPQQGFTLNRTIPAWGLISIAGTILMAGAGQGIALYVGQREQATQMANNAAEQRAEITRLVSSIADLRVVVEKLRAESSGANIATIRLEMRVDAIERWRSGVDQRSGVK